MPTQPRALATAVFVIDPKTHQTLLLPPGAQVTDPAIEEQITHPDAWAPEPARQPRCPKSEAS